LIMVTAVFLVTVGLCITALFSVKENGDFFAAKLEKIEQSADSGETEKTAEMILQFNEEWHQAEMRLSRFMRGDRLEELTAIFARLGPLFEYSETAEFYAEINRGKTLLEHMWLKERPTLKNIF
ncbi:MAG: DUF4363 family protein, partial [Oscillospiraceae bacterium]|nr:DUF4363 family protein [Oscillospiraceae bacterium]